MIRICHQPSKGIVIFQRELEKEYKVMSGHRVALLWSEVGNLPNKDRNKRIPLWTMSCIRADSLAALSKVGVIVPHGYCRNRSGVCQSPSEPSLSSIMERTPSIVNIVSDGHAGQQCPHSR